MRRAIAGVVLAAALHPTPVAAQRAVTFRPPVPATSGALVPQQEAQIAPGRAFLHSLVLPGAGQYVLDQRRAFAYLAVEAVGWLLWADRRREGNDLKEAYRDLAWNTARSVGTGPRTDGDFGYYESLAEWSRSGAWDAAPASPELEPETDADTYNGSIWLLARQIYFPGGPDAPLAPSDPAWQSALAYYEGRAYRPAFLWDWTGYPGEQDRYVRLIEDSDDRMREATIALTAVAANHVLSAADAFVSARLRESTGGQLDVELGLAGSPWVPARPGTPWDAAGLPPVVVGLRITH